MGAYISQTEVLVRLAGKVRVTDNPDAEPNRLPLLLLNRLIVEAESQVEQDLSTRYAAPFVTVDGGAFSQLPERPTRFILKTLCELMAVLRVLETDFGRGSGIDGSKYGENLMKRYNRMVFGDPDLKIAGLVSIRENSFNTFSTPPLPRLMSNYQVAKADTGFAGYVTHTGGRGNPGFPSEQINDPGENFWSGFVHSDIDHHFGGDDDAG